MRADLLTMAFGSNYSKIRAFQLHRLVLNEALALSLPAQQPVVAPLSPRICSFTAFLKSPRRE